MDTAQLPTKEFPKLHAAIKGLGETHEERRQLLGVSNTKYVARLLRRLPEQFEPFVRGKAGPTLLRALLEDLEERAA